MCIQDFRQFLKDKIILQGSINLINRIFNALSFDIMKNDSISVEIPSPKKKLCSILLLTFVVGVLDKMGISFLEQYHRQAIQMIESWNVSSSAEPQSSHYFGYM